MDLREPAWGKDFGFYSPMGFYLNKSKEKKMSTPAVHKKNNKEP